MTFKEMQLATFTEALASAEPTPGGGGASALVAAIGTALGNMVGSLTLGKKKYIDVQDEIIRLKQQCDALQVQFLSYIDADAEVFAPLAHAYGLPKETEEEAAHKAEVLEAALELAVSVPLKILDAACDAIKLMERFAEIGSRIAISDVACAASSLQAALKAAAVNVYINTKLMKRRDLAATINQETRSKVAVFSEKAEQIYNEIALNLQGETS